MFDMDGLLVDTEPLWFEVETEIMARLGGAWSHADQAQLVGTSLAKSVGYMLARAEKPTPPATIGRWMVDGMVDRIAERGVTMLPGAAELVDEVAAEGLPCALVTSSERTVMDAVLAQVGPATSAFDVTVCAADVSRTKPDPEPYLLATALLGADPARCVVLEDAPNGVAAAQAAGCLVVMVPSVAAVPRADRDASARGVARTGHNPLMVSSLRDVSVAWLRERVAARGGSAP